MNWTCLINWLSLFPILGLSGGIFSFLFKILMELSTKSVDSDLMLQHATSDLGLHCLPMSHKKDGRLIWVNQHSYFYVVNQVFSYWPSHRSEASCIDRGPIQLTEGQYNPASNDLSALSHLLMFHIGPVTDLRSTVLTEG